MIKETLLITAVHAFLPQVFDFVKAYSAYERENSIRQSGISKKLEKLIF